MPPTPASGSGPYAADRNRMVVLSSPPLGVLLFGGGNDPLGSLDRDLALKGIVMRSTETSGGWSLMPKPPTVRAAETAPITGSPPRRF